MSDEQAWNAIHFLKGKAIVVLDSPCFGICKVVLKSFDSHETGIAKCLRFLVEREPWKIPVNPIEVLQAAAEERQQEKILNSVEVNCNPVEDSNSVPDPTNKPDLSANGKASPSVQSELKLETSPSSAFPEEQAGTCSPMKLDPDHVRAAEMICANPVTIISGKAGCGKTTVVSQLFRAAVLQGYRVEQDTKNNFLESENANPLSQLDENEQRPVQGDTEILLTAPTGRAASLLSKKTKFKAYTLHQVLYSFMHSQKNLELWKFKDVRILVVDEGSMVPVSLLHSVLKMLMQHAELRKFIILGDVRQLPSIEPGNVLNDLFESLKRIGWAIEMATNHRAESQLIVDNAGRIADMGMKRNRFGHVELMYDDKVDLDGSHNAFTVDKKFIHIRLPNEATGNDLHRAVRFLIGTAPGLSDDSTSQFITFKRCDVSLINELCCKHYNNHTTKNHKNKLLFQPSDKVCCTKNGCVAVKEWSGRDDLRDAELVDQTLSEADLANQTQSLKNKNEKQLIRLCNGEIFFIRKDTTIKERGRSNRYVTLDDCDGRIFTVDFSELQRECKLQHAWARTIHTYQGSENETIVYVVGDSRVQRWKHLYTAVTRGHKRVYVVSKTDAIASCITRPETPRNTRLGGLVKEHVVQGQELVGTPKAQPNTPQGTPKGCTPQQSTPLCPGGPSSSSSASIQPKCLWKPERHENEATDPSVVDNVYSLSAMRSSSETCEVTEGNKERGRAARSAGNKRPRKLSAEHEEVPCKQAQAGDC